MSEPRIERLERPLADALAEFLAPRISGLPYPADLTRGLLSRRLLTNPIAAEGLSLVALEGDTITGFLQAAPRPSADCEGVDLSACVINLLLFDPGEAETGDAMIARALEHFRRRGAISAEALTASGGYPFFRGLFCGSEPALPECLPHVAEALARAGFSIRQELTLLSRDTSGLAAPGDELEGLAIDERDFPTGSLWLAESWRGLRPRIAAAKLAGAAAGRIVWTMLPGVSSRCAAGGGVGSIAELSVRSDLRRRGIGTALISRALASMRSEGAAECIVTAEADSEAAVGTYSAAGFTAAERMSSFRRLVIAT